MLDSTELILESVLETQLKLKIFHSSKSLSYKDKSSLIFTKRSLARIFLSFLYSITFKKVLSGKARNRAVIKYLQKFIFLLDSPENDDWKRNGNFVELDYTSTQYINGVYEICVKRNIR